MYCEDWGEALTNKSLPVICAVNLQSGSVGVLEGVPPDVSPGQVRNGVSPSIPAGSIFSASITSMCSCVYCTFQALWAPGSQSVFFVGWYHEPFRLGLKFCSNRRLDLWLRAKLFGNCCPAIVVSNTVTFRSALFKLGLDGNCGEHIV